MSSWWQLSLGKVDKVKSNVSYFPPPVSSNLTQSCHCTPTTSFLRRKSKKGNESSFIIISAPQSPSWNPDDAYRTKVCSTTQNTCTEITPGATQRPWQVGWRSKRENKMLWDNKRIKYKRKTKPKRVALLNSVKQQKWGAKAKVTVTGKLMC